MAMRTACCIILAFILVSCGSKEQASRELAQKMLADQSMKKVDRMARDLMKKGFYAGSGYQMVWARDLNTFVELSCEEYDLDILRENLLMFFHFQQENGELLDGYVPREGFNWDDPSTYESTTAPGHIGFKNTVETDQETSLIQALGKYASKTGDLSILEEEVAGMKVYDRLEWAIDYLLTDRYSEEYGLITGATTFDWGDVQVEGGKVVDIDELTHWCIDVYDNAMLAIALGDMAAFTAGTKKEGRWKELQSAIISNTKEHLWDPEKNKFFPHIYLDESPFPDDFDEHAIHFHGGTAVAIEAGILNREEISEVLSHMIENVKLSGAPSIGLTVYPPYPEELIGRNVSPPYHYQNGGDWTWFGGRMIQQLIAYGFVAEAYSLAKPMFDRVLENDGFYEWYMMDGTPQGSADFKGSAGVLAKSIAMFWDWARENQ
jgi:hypothetical protein